jgi:hypothetical protein
MTSRGGSNVGRRYDRSGLREARELPTIAFALTAYGAPPYAKGKTLHRGNRSPGRPGFLS